VPASASALQTKLALSSHKTGAIAVRSHSAPFRATVFKFKKIQVNLEFIFLNSIL
jgi:hypothetical protein